MEVIKIEWKEQSECAHWPRFVSAAGPNANSGGATRYTQICKFLDHRRYYQLLNKDLFHNAEHTENAKEKALNLRLPEYNSSLTWNENWKWPKCRRYRLPGAWEFYGKNVYTPVLHFSYQLIQLWYANERSGTDKIPLGRDWLTVSFQYENPKRFPREEKPTDGNRCKYTITALHIYKQLLICTNETLGLSRNTLSQLQKLRNK